MRCVCCALMISIRSACCFTWAGSAACSPHFPRAVQPALATARSAIATWSPGGMRPITAPIAAKNWLPLPFAIASPQRPRLSSAAVFEQSLYVTDRLLVPMVLLEELPEPRIRLGLVCEATDEAQVVLLRHPLAVRRARRPRRGGLRRRGKRSAAGGRPCRKPHELLDPARSGLLAQRAEQPRLGRAQDARLEQLRAARQARAPERAHVRHPALDDATSEAFRVDEDPATRSVLGK